MRKEIKNLAKKAVLATTLVASSLGLTSDHTSKAQAQDPNSAMYFFGGTLSNNAYTMGNRNNARTIHRLGHIMQDLAVLNAYTARTNAINNFRNNRNHPNQGHNRNHQNQRIQVPHKQPTVSGHVYTGFKDKNGNKWADRSDELIEKKNHTFLEDEPFKIGLKTTGLKGRTASYELISPNGEKVNLEGSKPIYIQNDNRFDCLGNVHNGLPETFEEHGPGVYQIRFFIDNQHVGTSGFLLQANPETPQTEIIPTPTPEQSRKGVEGYFIEPGKWIPFETKAPHPNPPQSSNSLESRANDFPMIKGRVNLRGLEIGTRNPTEAYFFGENMPALVFEKPVVRFADNVLMLRGSKTQASPDLIYHNKEGAKLIAQALAGGEIIIDFAFNKNKLETQVRGNYLIVNGRTIESNGQIDKLDEQGKKAFNASNKSMDLHITEYPMYDNKVLGQRFHYKDGSFGAISIPIMSEQNNNEDRNPTLGIPAPKASKYTPAPMPPTQKPLSRSQRNQLDKFDAVIRARKRTMNGDPMGFNFSTEQILQLNGDFSERNIRRNIRN